MNIKLNSTSTQIQSVIKLHHGQDIPLCQAQRVLQQLKHLHHSQHHENYAKIPNYLTRLAVLHISKGIVLDENNHIIDDMEPHFDIIYDTDK